MADPTIDGGAPNAPSFSLVPVDHDPFNSPATNSSISLVPVDHDPFAAGSIAQPATISSNNGLGAPNNQYQLSPLGNPGQVVPQPMAAGNYGDYSLVPIDHDPFAVPKPGQTVPASNPAAALAAAPHQAGSALLPRLTAYLDHYNDAATYPSMLPSGQAGKIPGVNPPSRLPGAIGDIATLALGGVEGALPEAAMRAAEATAPLEPFLTGAGAAKAPYSIGQRVLTDAGSRTPEATAGAEGTIGRAQAAIPESPGATSGSYTRAAPGRAGIVRGGSGGYSGNTGPGSPILAPDEVTSWQSSNPAYPEFRELAGTSGARRFHDAIAAAKAAHPNGPAMTLYSPEEYAGMRTFLTPDGSAGFALNGDDIVSVFRHPASPMRGATPSILDLATGQGGRTLDAFDTVLPRVYSESDFRAVSRTPFNPEFAPPGWNYQRMAPFNGGKPDVVFMVHDPAYGKPYVPGDGVMMPDYDSAKAVQQHIVGGRNLVPAQAPSPAQ